MMFMFLVHGREGDQGVCVKGLYLFCRFIQSILIASSLLLMHGHLTIISPLQICTQAFIETEIIETDVDLSMLQNE